MKHPTKKHDGKTISIRDEHGNNLTGVYRHIPRSQGFEFIPDYRGEHDQMPCVFSRDEWEVVPTMKTATDLLAITLRNDFHNAETRITCPVQCRHGAWCAYPTAAQMAHVRIALCGVFGCDCGEIRGHQFMDDGRRLTVIEPELAVTR